MTSPETPRGLFQVWGERILLGMTGLIPLFFALNLHDTFDLPKLTLVYVSDVLLLLLWGLQTMQTGILRLRKTPLDLPLVAFLAVALLSSLSSIDPAMSILGAYRIYVFGLLPMTAFALLYWLTAQFSSIKLRTEIVWTLVCSGALVGMYALLQYSGHEFFDKMPRIVGGHPWSSLGNPLYLGATCMMAIALGVGLLFDPLLSPASRITLQLLLGGNLIGLWLSVSRSAWTGLFASLVITACTIGKRYPRKMASLLILVAAIVVAGLIGSSDFRTKAVTLTTLHNASNAARIEGWKAGFRVFKAFPFLGSGPDTFFESFRTYRSYAYIQAAGPGVTQADAHNDIIQILSTMGIVGGMVFLWLLGTLIGQARESLKMFREEKNTFLTNAVIASAVLALVVQNQFNFSSVTTSAWAAVLAGLFIWSRPTEISIVVPHVCRSRGTRFLWLAGLSTIGYWCVRQVLADAAFQKGIQEAAMGRFLQSLDDHREAIRLNPWIETYPSELANRCRQIAQLSVPGRLRESLFDEAWAAAQSVPRRHPWDPDAWNNQGVAAMWLTQLAGRPLMPEARTAFEAAVQRDPVFVDGWANLAKWQHLNGNLDEEKRLWEKVLTMDPVHPMARQVLERDR